MKVLRKFITPSSIYVFINIVVCAVGFCRSFVFMKWMNINELGIISLVQTAILFLGLLQFGLINGGYRIFALDKVEEQRSINNLLFSYFALLTGVVTLFWLVLVVSNITLAISNVLIFVALLCGIFSLMMNWLTNTLIGKRLISEINKINLTAALFSLVLLPLVIFWGIPGAIISMLAQPLIFVGITLVMHKELRPNSWNFNINLVRYILTFGFIPFCAGIFSLVNLQIERWSIAEILGTEALGQFYLVFLYSTLFVLIPSSLLNIFFPRAIYAYENHDKKQFKNVLKKHFFMVFTYLIFVTLFTIFGIQFIIDLILPKHSLNTIYVFLFLPGLIAIGLCDTFSIIFNATVRLKPILIAGIISVLLTLCLIITSYYFDMFTLITMVVIKSVINIVIFAYFTIYIALNHRLIFRK